nr:DEAD/DEAH box helicase [Streptomyces flavidovirens]
MTTFRDLGILSETAEALEAVGIMSPFPIQEMTLPVALSGSDVIGQAKTGTGKTLGFGLPLLERVTVPADVEAGRAAPEKLTEAPQALVVVPTRELCQQVTNDLLTAGKVRNVRVLAIYGGRAYEPQVEALKKGVDIVVGTPGRLLDLAGQKKLDLSHVRSLVLDEADEMLDLGFLPDVEKIMKMLPPKRQTMLFSATMPGAVIGLARKYMSQPTHISATSPDDEGATVANITQHVFRAHNMDKPELVSRILQADGRGLAMIFCRTKRTAADIAEQLEKRGFASGAVHGDLGQGAREQALRAFRNGKVDVLVCTDVAARGIDVEGVTHVINYQSPEDEKTYLHRVGRTGRAGAKGIAVTLVDWDDIPRWKLINKALDLPFDEPEETYSTSAHLYEILSIPAGTKGILPRADRTRAGLRAEQVEDLGETGGRGRKSAPAAAAAPAIAEERAPRTPRQRRRTRNGAPVSADEATAVSQAPAAAEATEAPAEPRTPRRRRRTRAAEAVVETVEAPVPAPAAEPEAPKAPRRRTRAAAAVDTVDTVETAEGQVPAPAAESEAPKAPRRRSRAAAAVDTAESQVPAPAAEPEAPKAPRRRTRATKPAEAATEAPAPTEAEAVTEAPAKAPRRRTRAAAVDTAEGQVPAPAAEAEAPKAPRRRTRATKPAEAATEAEAAPAKAPRRRTRAAAAVDTAEGQVPAPTAEAEAPKAPRRRTRTTKPAEAATEAPAPTEAEAAPAKAPRRRTRAAAAVQPES